MTVVLCSKGYPGKYKKNVIINNLNKLKLSKNNFLYHAGTKYYDGKLISIGGRVLNFTSMGKDFSIRKNILQLIKKLNWKNGIFRRDIGWRVIKKNANY